MIEAVSAFLWLILFSVFPRGSAAISFFIFSVIPLAPPARAGVWLIYFSLRANSRIIKSFLCVPCAPLALAETQVPGSVAAGFFSVFPCDSVANPFFPSC